jgi:hypothetical protein
MVLASEKTANCKEGVRRVLPVVQILWTMQEGRFFLIYFGGRAMIIIYLVFKLMRLIISRCVWRIMLSFKIVLLPFKILFGKQKKKSKRAEEVYWDGFIDGSIYWD